MISNSTLKDAPYDYAKTVNKDHGRIEIRQCWTISDPEYLANIRDRERWQGLKTLVMITFQSAGLVKKPKSKPGTLLPVCKAMPKKS